MRHKFGQGTKGATFAISASLVGIGLFGLGSFGGSIASAALLSLTPGSSINFTSTPAPASLPTGALVASESFPLHDVGGATLQGTLTSWVFDDTPSSSTLDFVYQLTNTGNGDSFNGLTLLPFHNFTTNVGYQTGAVDPSASDRSVNGQNIDWTFVGSTAPTTSIGPGQSSDYLIIQTNATQWNAQGAASVIDGGTAQTGAEAPYLMPTVPEPASIGLIVMAGGMLMGRRRRA